MASLSVYPNPSAGPAFLTYDLPETTDLQVNLTDVNGRLLRVVTDKRDLTPGLYQESIVVDDLAPGLYLIRMQTEHGVVTQKLIKQ